MNILAGMKNTELGTIFVQTGQSVFSRQGIFWGIDARDRTKITWPNLSAKVP